MADTSPTQALDQVRWIERMCDILERPEVRNTIITNMVPVSMPPDLNAVVKISVWVGLGIVGLWAALDAFAERAGLNGSLPLPKRFPCQGKEEQSLMELEDIRNLYAHNYAGKADEEYFDNPKHRRHVLKKGKVAQLTCGGKFDRDQLSLKLSDLRYYAKTVKSILERFP